MSEWISVKDRTPDDGTREEFLICSENGWSECLIGSTTKILAGAFGLIQRPLIGCHCQLLLQNSITACQ